jgi:hypothetical protein
MWLGLCALLVPSIAASQADDEMAEIAKKLNNPVASIISLPFQNNFDFGGGPHDDGFQYKLNVQPVIPFTLNDKWNLITRTIVPVIHQENRLGNSSQSGLGDTTVSLFFSPKKPVPGGLIWGIGPDVYLPTATDALLGAEKWGIGPTAVALRQDNGWTYGALVNHIWSFAGDDSRQDISNTFLQPILSYQTKANTTFGLNLESSYDWENTQWTVPVNATVTQLVSISKQLVSCTVGARYYAEKPDGGPDWGLRFSVSLVFFQ